MTFNHDMEKLREMLSSFAMSRSEKKEIVDLTSMCIEIRGRKIRV